MRVPVHKAHDGKLGKHDPYACLYECLIGSKDSLQKEWILRCFKCGEAGMLDHTVKIEDEWELKPSEPHRCDPDKCNLGEGELHYDPIATVEPSIICPSCGAHYWITKGEIIGT